MPRVGGSRALGFGAVLMMIYASKGPIMFDVQFF